MSTEQEVQLINPEEEALIGETPAIFSNRIYVTAKPQGVKITFAEIYPVAGENRIRSSTAVFLQLSDFMALKNLIDHQARSIKSVQVPTGVEQDG